MAVYGMIRVIASAFLMGFAAAAPVGPVNIMAIRRGVLAGPRHTLLCGIGATLGDLLLFSLALWGGNHFIADLQSGRIPRILALVGLLVLLPFGVYFLILAARGSHRVYRHARRHWIEESIPTQLAAEGTRAFFLTILNPLAAVYWIGATSSWIPSAYAALGSSHTWWGILAAAAGMLTWFGGLALIVRFLPYRVSAAFFRIVNAALGLALIGLAGFCAIVLSRTPHL